MLSPAPTVKERFSPAAVAGESMPPFFGLAAPCTGVEPVSPDRQSGRHAGCVTGQSKNGRIRTHSAGFGDRLLSQEHVLGYPSSVVLRSLRESSGCCYGQRATDN